jgi:hypothetical protein
MENKINIHSISILNMMENSTEKENLINYLTKGVNSQYYDDFNKKFNDRRKFYYSITPFEFNRRI